MPLRPPKRKRSPSKAKSLNETIAQGSPFNPITPADEDKVDEFNLRLYTPIPDSYFVENGMDVKAARRFEAISHNYTKWLNKQLGYVSKSALKYQRAGQYKSKDLQDDEREKAVYRDLLARARAEGVVPTKI